MRGKSQQKSISFTSMVKSDLFQVKNHSNGSTELLMQDELNSLSLVSKDLEVLWNIKIGKKIKGVIHQVDFYKNRKLQYFFATDDQLHLIDRLGKYVIGFPREIATGTGVEFTTVVDYDNSKNYRFIIGDVSGKLFMFDKQGKVLPGWQPNRAGKQRILSLQHFKIAGKDYLMAIDENGAVYSFSRKGDLRKKFPLELNSRSHQGMLYKSRDDEKLFYFVTSDGFVIQFDGQGKIYKSDALVKSSVDSKYSLVSSQDGSTCVISRTDKGKIAVLNLDGTILFEGENQGSENQGPENQGPEIRDWKSGTGKFGEDAAIKDQHAKRDDGETGIGGGGQGFVIGDGPEDHGDGGDQQGHKAKVASPGQLQDAVEQDVGKSRSGEGEVGERGPGLRQVGQCGRAVMPQGKGDHQDALVVSMPAAPTSGRMPVRARRPKMAEVA